MIPIVFESRYLKIGNHNDKRDTFGCQFSPQL